MTNDKNDDARRRESLPDRAVCAATNGKLRDSRSFHARIIRIAREFSEKFSCMAKTRTWGNYTYCDTVEIRANMRSLCQTDDSDYKYLLKILFSARADFFTFVFWKMRKDDSGTIFELMRKEPKIVQRVKSDAIPFFEARGFEHLGDSKILDCIVPDKMTELDGVPANVFEVLFGEVV